MNRWDPVWAGVGDVPSSTLRAVGSSSGGLGGIASTPTDSGGIVWSGEGGLGLEEPALSERKCLSLEARRRQR